MYTKVIYMASFDYRKLRRESTVALQRTDCSPKKLVLLHTGVIAGVGLVLSILDYVLNLGIAGTGGLSGIGSRTILETIQSILQMAELFLLPFWTIGYIFVILKLIRRESTGKDDLLAGLRAFGPVLRTTVLRGLIYFAVIMAGSQIAGIIYMMTPLAAPIYAIMQELTEAGITDPYAMLENEAYLQAMLYALPFVSVGALALVTPVFYRLRFMDYALMDAPEKGAFHALGQSLRMTRGKCMALLKLDLRFWWYYGLELLILVVGYGNVLLPMLGIQTGMGDDTAMFVFYIASLLCQLGLYVWRKNHVFATYALVYEQLRQPPRPQPQPKPAPTNLPWKY